MSKKIKVRSLGGLKFDIAVGSEPGLAVFEKNGEGGGNWSISPNLRNIPSDAMTDLFVSLEAQL